MDFTDRDGTWWYGYVEAIPAPGRAKSLLPRRHLRFDSATASRAVTPVPAGAPFLAEERLPALLDRSLPLRPPVTAAPAPRDAWGRARRLAERGAALIETGRKTWRRRGSLSGALGARLEGAVGVAADRAIAFVASLLGREPRARP
jgi:hypothetical protein